MSITQDTIKVLEAIKLDPKARASINYAKAREAIQANLKNRADKRSAKMAVIEHLNGVIVKPDPQPQHKTPLPNYVQFPDDSKARF